MSDPKKCWMLIDPKAGGEVGRHYTEQEADELSKEWQEYWGYPLERATSPDVNCC